MVIGQVGRPGVTVKYFPLIEPENFRQDREFVNVIVAIDIALENMKNERSVHVPTDIQSVITRCCHVNNAPMFNHLETTKV